jgi:hypothetical protein
MGLHPFRPFRIRPPLCESDVRQKDVVTVRAPIDCFENFCASVVVSAGSRFTQGRASTQGMMTPVLAPTQWASHVIGFANFLQVPLSGE